MDRVRIELDGEQARLLNRVAGNLGVDASELVARLIEKKLRAESKKIPVTDAEQLIVDKAKLLETMQQRSRGNPWISKSRLSRHTQSMGSRRKDAAIEALKSEGRIAQITGPLSGRGRHATIYRFKA